MNVTKINQFYNMNETMITRFYKYDWNQDKPIWQIWMKPRKTYLTNMKETKINQFYNMNETNINQFYKYEWNQDKPVLQYEWNQDKPVLQ